MLNGSPSSVGGRLLRGGRVQVGAIERAREPLAARLPAHRRHRLADQLGQRRPGAGAVRSQATAQQRAFRERRAVVELAQRAAYGVGEVGLRERQQRRRVDGGARGLGRRTQLARGHQVQPALGAAAPPVAREHAVMAAADLEVRAGDALVVDVPHQRRARVRIGVRDVVPRQPRATQPLPHRRHRHHVEARRWRLVCVAVHDEAARDGLVPRARPVGLGVCPHPARARVALQVRRRRRLQLDLRQHAERLGPAAAQRDERPWLTLEPVRGDRGRLLPLMAFHHRQDRRAVVVAQCIGIDLPERLPVPERARHRVAAVQEDQVRHRALVLTPARRSHPSHDVAPDRTVQSLVDRRIAPAQVGIDHLARKVVRVGPVRAALHERALAQPREQLARVIAVQRGAHQLLGREPRPRRDRQRQPVARARNARDEPLQQRPHHVRHGTQLQRRSVPFLATLREHLHHQPERQRMPVRQCHQSLAPLLRHTQAPQQLARLHRHQVAQRHHPQQLAPARIAPPPLTRCRPTGHDDDRAGRQRGHEPLAQPILQPHGLLERVQQQHHTAPRRQRPHDRLRRLQPERRRQRRGEARGRRLEPPQVEPNRIQPRVLRQPPERL